MSDDLTLDAPAIEEVNDQIQDEPIEGEGAQDRPEDDATETQAETDGDERTLPRWIRDLKAARPDDFRAAKDHFFKQKELEGKLKDFDLDGVKSWLEEKGGRESLEAAFGEMEAKAQELDGINEAIASGNPDLIKEIAELHPESFGKLAVTALNEWSQRFPEDYSRVISGVFASTFRDAGFDSALDRASLYLEVGKPDEALKIIAGLKEWGAKFGEAAAKPASQPQRNDQISQREQTVNQREKQMYNDNYLGKLESQRRPMVEDALKDYFAMRPDSLGTKDRAIKAAIESIETTLGKDQQFVRAVQAFHAKGDADGALRLVKSREAKVLESVAKQIGEDFYGKLGPKPAQKTAPKATAKPVVKTTAPAKPKDKFAEIFASA